MHPDLREFAAQFLGTVMAALVPVVVTAFLGMPYALNRHPGEPLPPTEIPVARHLT